MAVHAYDLAVFELRRDAGNGVALADQDCHLCALGTDVIELKNGRISETAVGALRTLQNLKDEGSRSALPTALGPGALL